MEKTEETKGGDTLGTGSLSGEVVHRLDRWFKDIVQGNGTGPDYFFQFHQKSFTQLKFRNGWNWIKWFLNVKIRNDCLYFLGQCPRIDIYNYYNYFESLRKWEQMATNGYLKKNQVIVEAEGNLIRILN